jgi:hypothetical protein
MSALQIGMDNNAVDPGHQLGELVKKVQPHLSHLISRPHQEPIIGLYDEVLMAICEPLDKVYVMTTKGLAYVVHPLLVFTTKPRLMSHTSISLIEEKPRTRIITALQDLLNQQIRLFGESSV